MKMKIAVLALMFTMLPFEGQASFRDDELGASFAEDAGLQEIRLPGAPSGGFRGDYRFRVKAKGKRVVRKKATNRRARPVKRTAPRSRRDDG